MIQSLILILFIGTVSFANVKLECKPYEGGWIPTNMDSRVPLGRCAISKKSDCERAVSNVSADKICTHTCIGWKTTNVHNNHWCGSSVTLDLCIHSTLAARGDWICSYPSDGLGSHPSWVLTKLTSHCDYVGGQESLNACIERIPEEF